jgi:hypothetical protein
MDGSELRAGALDPLVHVGERLVYDISCGSDVLGEVFFGGAPAAAS